jgi:hypothetical protein
VPGATAGDSVQRYVGFLGKFLDTHTAPIDIEGYLWTREEVERVFSSAGNIECFRWRDSTFILDPDVKTVQDVINYADPEKVLVSFPLSMEPTDFRPPELRHSTSVLPLIPPIRAPDPMGYRVPHTFGESHLSMSSQMDLSPLRQEALPDSSSTLTEPYDIAPATQNAQNDLQS